MTVGRASTVSLIWQQTRYQNKIFWRTSISAFFTIIFPLLILVVFAAIFGSEEIEHLGVTVAQYYAPALAVFSAASATYTNIGVSTAFQRDQGILKRVRGTPLPPSIYLTGKIASATYIAAIAVVIMLTAGVLFYGVQIYARTVPAAIITFLVGVGCFAALGLVVAAFAPTGNAAVAIANSTLLPLAFFSGVFIPPSEELPRFVELIGDFFPLKHFNAAFQAAFNPGLTGFQVQWGELAYMAVWGIVAALVARQFFRWEPSRTVRTRRRREEVPA
ncbi:MAG: ABC transporter permease [Acidimicrobiia bacterium]